MFVNGFLGHTLRRYPSARRHHRCANGARRGRERRRLRSGRRERPNVARRRALYTRAMGEDGRIALVRFFFRQFHFLLYGGSFGEFIACTNEQ